MGCLPPACSTRSTTSTGSYSSTTFPDSSARLRCASPPRPSAKNDRFLSYNAPMTLKLVFMGTPEFATPALAELIGEGHQIACVYTRAPKPKGRGHREEKSPVHQLAESAGIEVRTPRSLKDAEEQSAFAALSVDAAVVVAYGLILPKAILSAPRLGCFNLHASLLP